MEVVSFPNCCGAAIATKFGHTDTALFRQRLKVEDVERELKSQADTYYSRYAFLIATVNDDQYFVYKEMFERLGWYVADKSYHANHDSVIYVMLKNLQKDKAGTAEKIEKVEKRAEQKARENAEKARQEISQPKNEPEVKPDLGDLLWGTPDRVDIVLDVQENLQPVPTLYTNTDAALLGRSSESFPYKRRVRPLARQEVEAVINTLAFGR